MRKLVVPYFILAGVASVYPVVSGAQNAPTYDASGTWNMQMSAPKLMSGECAVTDDKGYQEVARILQDGEHYTMSVREGHAEKGLVKGAVYVHSSRQQGVDPASGMAFVVKASSRFELSSANAVSGKTTLELDYADGAHCVFDTPFTGTRAGSP